MRVTLAYGGNGLPVNLPETTTLIEPRYLPGLPDEVAAVAASLAAPLGTSPLREILAAKGPRVCIVVSDLTRPVPNKPILKALLAEIASSGAKEVTILVATGLHRPNTPEELREMLGAEVVANYRVINHEAYKEEDLVYLGENAAGHPIWLNKEYVTADIKILTGFIEPHFFAGFSGGRKAILPGIAGPETIKANHSAAMIASERAAYGILDGNPIHEEMLDTARRVQPDFIINVATNKDHQITGVFSGDLETAHAAGVEFVRQTAMQPVDAPFDIVLTTNSGYPLDLNLYQAVKGIAAAEGIVKPGGAIILAAECREGIGQQSFAKILSLGTPAEIMQQILDPSFSMPDQWTAQILVRILCKHKVYLYSEHISDEESRGAHLIPVRDLEALLGEMVERAHLEGRELRVAALPQGPQVIPYLRKRE